jgi:hypothetical protein
MAFEDVSIQIQINGGAAQSGWSNGASAGAVISLSLSNTTGVDTYDWELIGRPEGSGAGGGGPEPLALGTSPAASFTVDLRGTYIIACTINGGSTNTTLKTAGVAYPSARTTSSGQLLRLLGPNETDEDTSDVFVAQGWIKMLNRWLGVVDAGGGGGGNSPLTIIPYSVVTRTIVPADIYALDQDSYATTTTVVLPSDSSQAIPVGSYGCVERMQAGTGRVTFSPDAGVTIQSPLGYLTIAAQYVTVMWIKTASNTYNLVGRLLP